MQRDLAKPWTASAAGMDMAGGGARSGRAVVSVLYGNGDGGGELHVPVLWLAFAVRIERGRENDVAVLWASSEAGMEGGWVRDQAMSWAASLGGMAAGVRVAGAANGVSVPWSASGPIMALMRG